MGTSKRVFIYYVLMETIWYTQFTDVKLCVWTITQAEVFPEARNPAYKLWIDFGDEIGKKKSSAQITKHYVPQELIWKQVIAVVNFEPKQIWPFMSECLVTWFSDENGDIVLVSPDTKVPNWSVLH